MNNNNCKQAITIPHHIKTKEQLLEWYMQDRSMHKLAQLFHFYRRYLNNASRLTNVANLCSDHDEYTVWRCIYIDDDGNFIEENYVRMDSERADDINDLFRKYTEQNYHVFSPEPIADLEQIPCQKYMNTALTQISSVAIADALSSLHEQQDKQHNEVDDDEQEDEVDDEVEDQVNKQPKAFLPNPMRAPKLIQTTKVEKCDQCRRRKLADSQYNKYKRDSQRNWHDVLYLLSLYVADEDGYVPYKTLQHNANYIYSLVTTRKYETWPYSLRKLESTVRKYARSMVKRYEKEGSMVSVGKGGFNLTHHIGHVISYVCQPWQQQWQILRQVILHLGRPLTQWDCINPAVSQLYASWQVFQGMYHSIDECIQLYYRPGSTSDSRMDEMHDFRQELIHDFTQLEKYINNEMSKPEITEMWL